MRAAVALVFAATLAAAVPARAATFTLTDLPDGRTAVRMDGKIEQGDARSFATITHGPGHPAALVLASPGGDLMASLAIGAEVQRAAMNTVVAPHASCVSGCGLVWLAGLKRYIASDATVGFHAVKSRNAASITNTEAASATVGAYMARLGLSDAAIQFMNSAPPSGMAWLGWDKAKDLGIKISPFVELTGYPRAARAQ